MDALVPVHERHSPAVEVEPAVERALVRKLAAELGVQGVERVEAAQPQQLVPVHGAIVLRAGAAE